MSKAYRIVIEDRTENKRKTTAATVKGGSVSSAKTTTDAKEIKTAVSALYYGKRALNVVVSYSIDTVQLRTGNVKAQQNASFAYSIISGATDVGESIAVGAATGGAPGAIAGAVIGAAFKVANIIKGERKIDLAQSVEDVSRAQNAIRIGAGGQRMGAVK